MNCPNKYCKSPMKRADMPIHNYTYFSCPKCGTEVRIIWGNKGGLNDR